MVDLHRAHTIHEDYARNHKLFKLPRTSLGALCVASGVGVATYYACRSFVTSTQIERIDEDDGDDETRRGVAIVLG